jgi:DNA ligase (NAD+)
MAGTAHNGLAAKAPVSRVVNTTGTSVVAGKKFVLTGAASRPRKEIAADIEAAGGIVADAINGTVQFLVQSDPSSKSSKTKKAEQLGIKVISEETLMHMIGL